MPNLIRKTRPVTSLLAITLLLCGCAAQKHLKRGEAAWDRGDAVSAEYHYESALSKKHGLADDPGFTEALRLARRDAALQRGDNAAANQQWQTAVREYEAALDQEPGYAPAAQGRAEAGSRAAAELYAAALQRADGDDLPAARMLLEKALRMQPGMGEVEAALASLDEGPAKPAPLGYADAVGAVGRQRWAEGRAGLRAVITLEPTFLPARAALHRMHGAAADDYLDRAKTAMNRRDPDGAERWLGQALDYRPNAPKARRGLADADILRGRMLAEDNRPGAGLLATRAAFEHVRQDRRAQAAIDRYTRQLRATNAVTLALTHDAAPPHLDATQALTDLLGQGLSTRYHDTIRITQAGNANHVIRVNVDDLAVSLAEPHEENRRHRYEVEYTVPNPALEQLRNKLHYAQSEIADLAHDESRIRHRLAAARHDHDYGRVERLERKLHRIRCDLGDARKHRDHVSYELRSTPATICKTRTKHWPYTLLIQEQIGTLRGRWSLDGQPGTAIRADFHETDEVIGDANPQIGLHADPLELTDPQRVAERMIEDAARQITKPVAGTVLRARVAELDTLAEQAEANGDAASALEHRVGAAVLAMLIGPAEAESRLDALAKPASPTG